MKRALLLLLATIAGAAGAAELVDSPIVNGTLTAEYPSVGAFLTGTDPDTALTHCSGVLIGCQTFLTAGHCVCDANGAACQGAATPGPELGLVYFDHAGFVPIASIQVHPDYEFPVADVAVVHLAEPVTAVAAARIADVSAPPFGTSGTIVGFGVTVGSDTDSGVKRAGAITTAPCVVDVSDATSVCWDFASTGANTCSGDSGGPLFVDLGTGPVVAGVTSGGVSASCLPTDHSYDANVFAYRDYIAAQAGPDLGTTCGPLPAVGSPGVATRAFTGTLDAAHPFALQSLGVAAGTSELRVAMHGSEADGNDFDLYVRGGAAPAAHAFDCRAIGPNQFGFCRVENPAPGSWFVRAERAAGAGAYQIVATAFGGEPAVCGNGVREPGEDCDGADTGTCVTGCDASCACVECSPSDLDVTSIVLDPRFVVRATLGDGSGGYTALDPPTAGVTLILDDGGVPLVVAIPKGDPGWVVRNARRGRYRWRGTLGGVRRMLFRTRAKRPTAWNIRVAGRNVGGARALGYDQLVVRVLLGDRCAAKQFHPERTPGLPRPEPAS